MGEHREARTLDVHGFVGIVVSTQKWWLSPGAWGTSTAWLCRECGAVWVSDDPPAPGACCVARAQEAKAP